MSKFDIVIPSYNRLEYLKLALESALNQDFDDYRVIVVDAASTDGTQQYLKLLNNPRLEVILCKDNLGMFGNWSRAMDYSNADYLALFHDDDILDKDFLKRHYRNFQSNKNIVISHTAANLINHKGEVIGCSDSQVDRKVIISEDFLKQAVENPNKYEIIAPSVAINRELLPRNIRLNHKFHFWGDLDFWVRASKYGGVSHIPFKLVSYRVHEDSGTSQVVSDIEKKLNDRLLFEHSMLMELDERGLCTRQNVNNLMKLVNSRISRDVTWIKRSGEGGSISVFYAIAYIIRKRPSILNDVIFILVSIFSLIIPKFIFKSYK